MKLTMKSQGFTTITVLKDNADKLRMIKIRTRAKNINEVISKLIKLSR